MCQYKSLCLKTSQRCISDEALLIYMWVVWGVVCQIINVFGIVTNIINIICFVRQGFQDSTNVSLVGLSISDIGCLTTLFMINLFITPTITEADLSFEPVEVKVIFTPKRTCGVIVCIFIIFFGSIIPVYVVNSLDMKFSPLRNKTVYGLVFTEDKEIVEMITFAINNFALSFVAFIIIVVRTTVLVIQLKSATKWRMKSADKSQSENVSSRNQKVAKMVVMISGLFIACFVPISTSMLALAFEPELSFNGKYSKIILIVGGISFTLESINSSMNIFIYYNMSSKYREDFHKVIFRNKINILF